MPENQTAYEICGLIRSGLIVRHSEQVKDAVRAYRGVSWATIDAALTRFEIPRGQWQPMIRKILAFAHLVIEDELKDFSR
jgi:hypothetical protein